MLLDAEIFNKKHFFFVLYFTTEDMKFLKWKKKERFVTKYSVHNSTEQHNSTY